MKTVHKYGLPLGTGLQSILMPEGAEILAVRMQMDYHGYENPYVWAKVDLNEPPSVTRVFRVFGTGEAFNEEGLLYVDTYQLTYPDTQSSYVYHVYEQEMS